jgi:predicted phage tail protein
MSVDEPFIERGFAQAQIDGEESFRGFLAKHLNVEIGLALRSDRWAGAEFWEVQAKAPGLTLDDLIERCEVIDTRANADAALGQRIDTVQSSLGNTNASVQQTSTALAGLNGQVNAQYSVKVMTTSSGMKVAAGFGLGLESEGGITQSTFAVSADRFVVLNANLGGAAQLTSPFAVVGGQVFISDAFIQKATITKGLVGETLSSLATAPNGEPRLRVDFNGGQLIYVNRNNSASYRIDNDMNSQYIVDGRLRVRIGSW